MSMKKFWRSVCKLISKKIDFMIGLIGPMIHPMRCAILALLSLVNKVKKRIVLYIVYLRSIIILKGNRHNALALIDPFLRSYLFQFKRKSVVVEERYAIQIYELLKQKGKLRKRLSPYRLRMLSSVYIINYNLRALWVSHHLVALSIYIKK